MKLCIVLALCVAGAFAAPKCDVKDFAAMASNYWVRQVGPASDLTAFNTEDTFTGSFGATKMGMLTGDQYMSGGLQMQKCGFAKTFGADLEGAVQYLNELSGQTFESLEKFQKCAMDKDCDEAIASDPALVGHNVTVVNVNRIIDGLKTVRCHFHETGSWCHSKVKEFNMGTFYLADVTIDGDETKTLHQGLFMCHEFSNEHKEMFLARDTKCHTMPKGVAVLLK